MHGVHCESLFFSLSPFLPHLFDGKCIIPACYVKFLSVAFGYKFYYRSI